MINIIAAVSQNNVIGRDGKLPWNYPADFKWFRGRTLHSTIIMGRKTWESIGASPFMDRTNIVISKNAIANEWEYADSALIQRWQDGERCLENFIHSEKDIWVIGGAEIYKLALPYAHRIYLTAIPEIIMGENLTFFPDWQMEEYECVRWEQNFDDPRLYHSVYQRIDYYKE